METATFKTTFVGVRPPRVVTLLDKSDPDWEHTCLRIIEFYCSVWGGKYNILVPTNGREILPEFWKLLDLYDPDYCFAYAKTYGDLKVSDPKRYEELLRRQVAKAASGVPSQELERVRDDFDKALQNALASKFEICGELQATLIKTLAVLHHGDRAVESHIYAGTTADWHLTKLADALGQCEHEDKVAIIHGLIAGLRPLWLAAVTGCCSNTLIEELTTAGLGKVQVQFSADRLAEAIRLGVKGYHDVSHSMALNALRIIEGNQPASTEDLSPYFPFQLSMAQLGQYRPIDAAHREEPSVVIVGETLEDFAWYYCLSRIRPNVSWLPPSWCERYRAGVARIRLTGDRLAAEESLISHFALVLSDRIGLGSSGKCEFVSLSLCSKEVGEVIDTLASARGFSPGEFRNHSEIREVIDTLPTHPQTVFERDNISKPRAVQFINKELPGWFETPKPLHFRQIKASQFKWITELSIKGNSVPRHPALGPQVIRHSWLGSLGVRAGRNGVAYYCPNMLAVHGVDVDQLLVKPSLYLPDALDVFQWVAGAGGCRCATSQKGVFAQETMRKFGSLSSLAEFLRNPVGRRLLDKFLDISRPADGEHEEGVLLASDRRRYLDLASVRKIAGSNEDPLSLIDQLVLKGVIHRGFIFKCQLCRNADWFSVGEISTHFKCRRCGLQQTYGRAHVLRDAEPSWFYKLDELVFRAHQNGFAVPILALDYFRRQSRDTFLFTPELEFFPGNGTKPFIEVDICYIRDGVLSIGEAKTSNILERNSTEATKTLRKYRYVAERLGAREVVFATTKPGWSAEMTDRIKKLFSNLPTEIIFLGCDCLLS